MGQSLREKECAGYFLPLALVGLLVMKTVPQVVYEIATSWHREFSLGVILLAAAVVLFAVTGVYI